MADAGSVTSGSPMKPPRGQKLGRETGILMTVIKALLSSASASERDGIKTTVEQEYKTLDKNLDALILNKQESLNTVMQVTFTSSFLNSNKLYIILLFEFLSRHFATCVRKFTQRKKELLVLSQICKNVKCYSIVDVRN